MMSINYANVHIVPDQGLLQFKRKIMKKLLILMMCSAIVFGYDATILKIIDGDTVKVNVRGETNSTKVRFANIDTPEKFTFSYKAKGDITSCGKETVDMGKLASAHLKEMITENNVIQITDTGMTSHERDVGTIYYNGNDINLQMVKDGYAIVWHPGEIKDVKYRQLLLANEINAKANKQGLWRGYPTQMNCLQNLHKGK